MAGETLSGFLLPSLPLGPFGVLFIAGLVLLVVRHLLWPRPHLGRVAVDALFGPDDPDRGTIMSIVTSTRAAILLAGLLSVMAFGYQLESGQPRLARNELLNLPARFDAGWYMGIARHGYEWREDLRGRQQPVAFFPAYPLAVRVSGDLVTVPAKAFDAPGFLENGNTRVLWGGVLVSLLCVLAAAGRIAALAQLETNDRRAAIWVVTLTMLWPFALFFSTAYSEAMFLLALAGALLAWRQQRLGHAAAWGLLCGLSRSNGWSLSLALLADVWLSRRKLERRPARIAAALVPAIGAALFSAYVFTVTGDPFEWARAQQAWGRELEPLAFFTRRWGSILRDGFLTYVVNDPSDFATFLCVTAALAAAAWLAVRRRWLYATVILAYLAPAVAIDLPAAGRMTAVLFPIFLVVVETSRPRTWVVVGAVCGAIQLGLAARHFIWKPPF